MPNITNIPSSRVDFIDPRTGLMSREWYRFFLNLFALVGGGSNDISLQDLQIGPVDQDRSLLIDPVIEQSPPSTLNDQQVIQDTLLSQITASFEARIASLEQQLLLAPPVSSGSVTSVDVSGGSTGLTTSGGPIITSGTITLGGLLSPLNGGTGVANNAASTLTISGSFASTFTLTGVTSVTFPTSGTLATTAQLPVGANPSASVGLTTINGSATSFLRSDGAPALSQSISPTWTGNHTFTPLSGDTLFSTGNVGIGVSPGYKLHVSGSVASGGTIDTQLSNTTAGTAISMTLTGSAFSYAGVGANGSWLFPQNSILYVGSDGAFATKIVSNGAVQLVVDGSGVTCTNYIKTASSGSGSGNWKLGPAVAGIGLALNTSSYVEIDIDGTVHKLAKVL